MSEGVYGYVVGDVMGCRKLMAQVVHDGLVYGDTGFLGSEWFEDICGLLGWDAEALRERAAAGEAPRRRRSFAEMKV